jgi:tetratricopeptide (TPR) repeat protein
MKIAVLPLNAGPDVRPALGRQISAFLAERGGAAGIEQIGSMTLTMNFDDEGVNRIAQVNASEALNEPEMVQQFLDQSDVDAVIDGLLEQKGGTTHATLRWWKKGDTAPFHTLNLKWDETGFYDALKRMLLDVMSKADVSPVLPADDKELFGTESEKAFLGYMEGLDAAMYVERSQGLVVKEFTPRPSYEALLDAIETDPAWGPPLATLVQLARMAATAGLGTREDVEYAMKRLGELLPDDARAIFAQAEFWGSVGDHNRASELLEKAARIAPNEPGIWARLGGEQMALNMPVNAERSFRKAIDLEPEDNKISLDSLAQVLFATNRAHEVPTLWQEMYDKSPTNPEYATKLALSLRAAGQEKESDAVFEKALGEVEEPVVLKRHYAPILREKGELDRAMDLYEDVLDEAPTEIPVLLEYAQTLQAADREFEIPKILRDVMNANPDPNTRAQTQAWLIQLEQPKRVEAVASAHAKAQSGDFEGAMKELRPLRNWLGDYWPLWAALAGVHNALGEFNAAEEAARRLLEMFPACEPGYGEYCNALLGQGRPEDAYNFMRGALNAINTSPAIAINFAFAARAAGHTDEANEMAARLREALDSSPELEEVLKQIESPLA